MNMVECYTEDEEKCIDSPLYGGKAKVKVTSPDENTLKICSESEKFGKVEVTEVFTEQGFTMTLKSSKGASMTENWTRWVCEEGSYRYVCNEGAEEYTKAQGHTQDFSKMMCDHGFRLEHLGPGDVWMVSERFGGTCHSQKVEFDKEIDWSMPGWERKMLMTRLAPGKVKCIMRCPKTGQVEEWMRWISPCGKAVWCGEDKKTGKKCKIVYEKFTCPVGTWRPVAMYGVECMMKAGGEADRLKSNESPTF